MTRVKYLREQSKAVKHVTFSPSGELLAVSCSDGIVNIYSMLEEDPKLVRKVDGVIRSLDTEDEATSRVVWHPDGTAFAAAEATRDIAIVSTSAWTKQKTFASGHTKDITALAWSPNGAFLASAGADGKIVLWETKTQNILQTFDFGGVINLVWHPTENTLAFTTSDGELFIHENFVPAEYKSRLDKALEAAPLRSNNLAETSGNVRKPLTNGAKGDLESRPRRGTPDSLDDILGPMDEDDDFIEDDDGAGYAEGMNEFGKRTSGHLDDPDGHENKRLLSNFWQPKSHTPFQPGNTPWRGNRRYLCTHIRS
jgi:chromosome transmission fidelity protein 4